MAVKLSQEESSERRTLIVKRTGFVFPAHRKPGDRKIEAHAMEWIFGDFLVHKHPKKQVLKVIKHANLAAAFDKLIHSAVTMSSSRLDWFAELSDDERNLPGSQLTCMLATDIKNCRDFLGVVLGNSNILRHLISVCWSIEDVFDLVVAADHAVKVSDAEIEHMYKLSEETKFNRWITWGFLKSFKSHNPLANRSETPTYTQILDLLHQPIYSPLLKRLQKHPNYLHSPRQWTAVLFDHKHSQLQTTLDRRIALRNALEVQGMKLRYDSRFCNEYIDGTICSELAEVVATMKLTCTLFAYGHAVWKKLVAKMEKGLLMLVVDDGLVWMEAVGVLVSSSRFIKECVDCAARCGAYNKKRGRGGGVRGDGGQLARLESRLVDGKVEEGGGSPAPIRRQIR
ncbi:hypothetical protein HDU98_010507 [Podochytrium sp. JEL0797]|nr:hypothetical protein HDU98_010507 [Podochytrium sp. JEL0797]